MGQQARMGKHLRGLPLNIRFCLGLRSEIADMFRTMLSDRQKLEGR